MEAAKEKKRREENLINPSKLVTYRKPVSPSTYKSVLFEVLTVLSAAGFGFAYYRYLTQGLPVLLLLAALSAFAALSALQIFFAKMRGRTLIILALETIALIAFFWRDDWRILLTTGIVMFGFLNWGYFSGRLLVANSVEIPFFGATAAELGKFTTGILIFMILIYVPQIGGNPLIVSQQNFRTFFDWASGAVNGFYPQLSLHGSFGGFSESLTQMELENNPSFQNLTPAQKSATLQQGTQQFEQNFLKTASATVATSSPASDAFYNILEGMLSAWQSQSGGWFILGWAAVIFVVLRSVGVVFVWVAQFVTLVIYEILLATGAAKISEEVHVKETIGF